MTLIRKSPFALRVVERSGGKAAIVYRRKADAEGRDRFQRIAVLGPLAFTAATPMIREGMHQSSDGRRAADLAPGPYHPLDADWGAKIACFALLTVRLRDGERLLRAAGHLRNADPNEAAWWLGMLTNGNKTRALRALRILTEAVE